MITSANIPVIMHRFQNFYTVYDVSQIEFVLVRIFIAIISFLFFPFVLVCCQIYTRATVVYVQEVSRTQYVLK